MLYVESDADTLVRAKRLVGRRKDWLLLCAVDAIDAVEISRREEPDAILIARGAIGLLAILRAEASTQATPILAVGADAAPEAVVNALEAGFFQYLTTPLRAAPLMEALDFALEFTAADHAEPNPLLKRAARHPTKEPR